MFYLLALVVAASRFLPHPPNVACVGALGLFAGCYLTSYRAYLLPLAAMALSDVTGQLLGVAGLGFYHPATMATVYGGMTVAVWIGRQLAENDAWLRIAGGSLAVSTSFFLISNFGVWLGGWYPASLTGLAACYANAIPFYGYTLAGDLMFSGVLFGAWHFASVPARRRATATLAV